MAKLTVSVAGVDYDRTRALFDGTVPIAGCETICCAMSPEEAFHRAFRYQEFDITELSFSSRLERNCTKIVPVRSLFHLRRTELAQADDGVSHERYRDIRPSSTISGPHKIRGR